MMSSFCTLMEPLVHKELYAISKDKVGLVCLEFFLWIIYVNSFEHHNLLMYTLGRLTLTNYAVYFEASGIVSYEDAIKLDLSKDIEQSVKPAATGPLGAPLFDKAIIYKSSEL